MLHHRDKTSTLLIIGQFLAETLDWPMSVPEVISPRIYYSYQDDPISN